MNEQKPSVGRAVHYQSYGTPNGEYKSKPVAATITLVEERQPTENSPGLAAWHIDPSKFRVGLAIFNPSGLFFNEDVPYSDTPKPGHWSWPPRVP